MQNLKTERAKHNLHPYHSCLSRGKRLAHEFQIKIVRNAQYVLEDEPSSLREFKTRIFMIKTSESRNIKLCKIFFRMEVGIHLKLLTFGWNLGEPCIRCYYPKEWNEFRNLIHSKVAAGVGSIPGEKAAFVNSFVCLRIRVLCVTLRDDDSHAAGDWIGSTFTFHSACHVPDHFYVVC